MIIKIIFLIMLCIPIGCFQHYLLVEAAKDLKKPRTSAKRASGSVYQEKYRYTKHLRLAK
ncbi:hypothetical protein QBE52_01420 [Clostridiaceae bacterium 35-E11]